VNELDEAIILAKKVLARTSADPDDDLAMLARQFLRSRERIQDLQSLMARAADALEFWMKDLASTEQQYVDAAMRDERLLAELRKAADLMRERPDRLN
jgi:hypothetical protein